MEDKEKLRKIISETRIQKNMAREKVSELLKRKGVDYAESSLQRYETGKTRTIRAEVIKGLSEILGLDTIEMYKLAGLINKSDREEIAFLPKKQRAQLEDVLNGANMYFNDENVSEEDKEKFKDSLIQAYWVAKAKNKEKRKK